MSYRQVAHVVFWVLMVVMLYLSNALVAPFSGVVGPLVLASIVEIVYWSFDELIRKP